MQSSREIWHCKFTEREPAYVCIESRERVHSCKVENPNVVVRCKMYSSCSNLESTWDSLRIQPAFGSFFSLVPGMRYDFQNLVSTRNHICLDESDAAEWQQCVNSLFSEAQLNIAVSQISESTIVFLSENWWSSLWICRNEQSTVRLSGCHKQLLFKLWILAHIILVHPLMVE